MIIKKFKHFVNGKKDKDAYHGHVAKFWYHSHEKAKIQTRIGIFVLNLKQSLNKFGSH